MSHSLVPFSFESHEVRVLTDGNGEPLFVAKDVATILGYSNTRQAVITHCKHAKPLKDIGVCQTDSLDNQTVMIPESDIYRLTMKSTLDSAERFQDWLAEDVLPSIRKTGQYVAPAKRERSNTQLAAKMMIARAAKSMLRMSATSVSRMLADIAESEGLSPTFLPSYVDETLTKAIGTLLKEHGSDLSAIAANKVLVDLGFLEELSRIGSGGTVKKFKSVTKTGLEYGRNETSPNNPRETQPLYYVGSFTRLLGLIEARRMYPSPETDEHQVKS